MNQLNNDHLKIKLKKEFKRNGRYRNGIVKNRSTI